VFSSASTPPRFITLVFLTAISVLSLNMFLPSLSNIAREFEVEYWIVNLSIAGYLAISAVLQIIMGPLSDRWGRRPILLAAMAIFAVASVGCWLSANIWMFLGFRMLQSAVIAGMALSRAVIRDMAPPKEAARMMGYVAMVMALAPMLGPVVGGLIDQAFGWRVTFFVFAALGVLVFVMAWVDLGETNQNTSETFLQQFQTYPELFGSGLFWGHVICQSCSVGAFYAFLAGAPLIGEVAFGLSPVQVGIGMGAITGGFVIGNYFTGRYALTYSLGSMMVAGRIVAVLGVGAGLIVMMFGYLHPVVLFGSVVFIGVGNGLTLPASNSGAMSVKPELAGSASGLSGAAVVAAGAILTFGTGAVLNETSGAYVLMAILMAVNVLGLISAMYVRAVEP
jgi:DHA1 family bicyclomycin/chloramphenicol resistance-like MFS transporter